jgi:hypothetical protein
VTATHTVFHEFSISMPTWHLVNSTPWWNGHWTPRYFRR